jgi:hypothetical protein
MEMPAPGMKHGMVSTAYERDCCDIARIYGDRQQAQHPVIAQMEKARAHYRGEIVVPLPELDKNEVPAVANLFAQGLDDYGRRIASTTPDVTCPPTDPRQVGSRRKAETRRKATLGWWEANRVELKLYRRARLFVGYGMSPVVLRPDFDRGIPKWETRNPLTSFPAPMADPDGLTPDDCVHAVKRSLGYLRRVWPTQAAALCPSEAKDDELFTVLEYDDHEQTCYLALNNGWWVTNYQMAPHMLLEQVPNRTGLCLAVTPPRITLDRVAGQFDGILGMYQMQAKLMALNVHAVQRGVFPDTYLVSRMNETAKFISGPHPGYTGQVNIVEGGDIRSESPNPGFMTTQTIDRLENAQRVEGGISPDTGGQSSTNIRTGRRGDSIMSATVDLKVAEAQQMLAASLEEENRRATKIAKAYFGDRPQSFHVRWKGSSGRVDYTPSKDFDSDYTTVSYPMAGTDIQNLTIGLGQLLGTQQISKETARRVHPWIADADLEGDLVTTEGLETALLQGLQTQAAAGQLPPSDLARIMQLVRRDDLDLVDAVLKVQEEAQQRQAAMPPDPAAGAVDPAAGVDPNSPEAQPGIAVPGAGAEAGVAVPPPSTSLGNLDQLLQSLRGTGMKATA